MRSTTLEMCSYFTVFYGLKGPHEPRKSCMFEPKIPNQQQRISGLQKDSFVRPENLHINIQQKLQLSSTKYIYFADVWEYIALHTTTNSGSRFMLIKKESEKAYNFRYTIYGLLILSSHWHWHSTFSTNSIAWKAVNKRRQMPMVHDTPTKTRPMDIHPAHCVGAFTNLKNSK